MFDDAANEHSGGGDDDVPWSRETFNVGDRVRWTEKAIRHNVPTKTRRDLRGVVTKVEVGDRTPYTYTVHVLWDGYKRPHSYAAAFITKSTE